MPEIKTILSGTSLEQYVHWKNMMVKVIGMATVGGSGMYRKRKLSCTTNEYRLLGMILGKPLSHVGAVIASELLRFPFFKKMGTVRDFTFDTLSLTDIILSESSHATTNASSWCRLWCIRQLRVSPWRY